MIDDIDLAHQEVAASLGITLEECRALICDYLNKQVGSFDDFINRSLNRPENRQPDYSSITRDLS